MGLGVTTGGRGGELSVEPARLLVPTGELSVSLSEAAEPGREIVRTEDYPCEQTTWVY
jgi:hypothetical protein